MAIPVTLIDARRTIRLEDDDDSRDTDLEAYIANYKGGSIPLSTATGMTAF